MIFTRFLILSVTATTIIMGACNKSNEPTSDSTSNDDGNTSATTTAAADVLSGVTTAGDVATFKIAVDKSALSETVTVDAADEDYIENATFDRTIYITYSTGGDAVVTGDDNATTAVSGNHVTVNNTTDEIVRYVLSGTTTNGNFKLYSARKQSIELNGAHITNPTGAAINNQSKKRTFIVVTDGSDNSLTDGTSYTDVVDGEDMKACLFSEGQLVFSGKGTLSIDANCKAGVRSDDYVRFMPGSNVYVDASSGNAIRGNDAVIITGGVINAIVSGTADKGISSDGYVQVDGGRTTVLTTGGYELDEEDNDYTACAGVKADGEIVINGGEMLLSSTGIGGKGLNCDGTITINGGTVRVITTGQKKESGTYSVSPKGIKADGDITFNGGKVIVRCSGGEGSEGIESKGIITIDGGIIESYCYDDAINSAGNLTISGGAVYAHATGNDGIDANKNLYFSGGVTVAEGAGGAECGIDAAEGYTCYINGGTVIACGGNMQEVNSSSKQASVTCSTSNGLKIGLVSGTQAILHYVTPSSSASALMISSPSLKSGSSYTLRSGSTASGGTSFYSLTTGCTLSGGSQSADVTASIAVSGSMGGGGFGPGGGRPW